MPKGMVPLLMLAFLLLGTCARGAISTPEETLTSPPPSHTPDRSSYESITLALAGEVMLGRFVNQAIHAKGPLYPWGDVLPLVREADLSLVNLECVIAEGGELFTPPRVFYFKADPEAIEVLTSAGIDYVTLSNNHALDFQAPALLETIRHLDEHGIAHAGAGGNAEEASRYALLEARGIKVGVVAFADHFREYAATESKPGTNVIPIAVDERYFHRVRESIEAVRAASADLVVFSINDQQLLFLVYATSEGVERVELIPLLISYMQVNRATGTVFDEICERIDGLSESMGTEIRQEGDRLVVEFPEH